MTYDFKSKSNFQEYFGRAHAMVRRAAKEFVDKEIVPWVDDWEEAGEFPRELYKKAGDVDLLGIGYPEQWGGTPGDVFFQITVWEEIMRGGSGGVAAGLGSLHIALPPIISRGTDEQKERYVKPVIKGDKIAALAITEPEGGSDVAGLQATAERQADEYVVNGSKTFITSGCRADQITCAVRTGGPGPHGISLLVIESKLPGYSVSDKLKKTGWWSSDTGQIFFDNCRVPAANLIGQENEGFYKNFACMASDRLTYDAVQIFGGYGFMRGYPVERLFRDNRVLSIGGGTTEIMKEIISKHIL